MSKQKSSNYSFGNIFLSPRFFKIFAGFVGLIICSHFIGPTSFTIVKAAFYCFLLISLGDFIFLFSKEKPLQASRIFPNKVLSLGDANTIRVRIEQLTKYSLSFQFIDELPQELQVFDFEIAGKLQEEPFHLDYKIEPKRRGLYTFGDMHFLLSSSLKLIQRRYTVEQEAEIKVFPSIYQMKRYSLMSLKKIQTELGVKKLRKLGHSYEFEQIKNYVAGDDVRTINWKATSRLNTLMVNHYQDEKSQQVYFLIDKSRPMNMPFEGLSLVDYAINSSLVLSNIAIQKQDKAGLISFSDKIGSTLKANNNAAQMRKIMNALYKERYRSSEANYELLFQISRKLITRRSLIFLFSNFETLSTLNAALPHIRRINKRHLLVLIVFENTEVKALQNSTVRNTKDVYLKTIANKYVLEKKNMIQILKNYGIQTIFTTPEQLTINSINKYLELKSRGLI